MRRAFNPEQSRYARLLPPPGFNLREARAQLNQVGRRLCMGANDRKAEPPATVKSAALVRPRTFPMPPGQLPCLFSK